MFEKDDGELVGSPLVGSAVFILDETSDIMQQCGSINEITVQVKSLFIRNNGGDSGNVQKVGQVMAAETAIFFVSLDSV